MTLTAPKSSQGFAMIGVVVVIIVALVAVAAYLLWSQNNTSSSAAKATDTSPAVYQSNEDLDDGSAALDDIQIDAELDSSLEKLDAEASQF